MHPIERLRYVARAGGVDHGALAEESARALAAFTDDPVGLVTASRRIVDRQATSGPMWWMASTILSDPDPRAAAVRCVTTLQDDPTPAALAYELPDDVTVAVIGWPEQAGDALVRRGDLRALVVDALGEGSGLVRRLEMSDGDAIDVPPTGIGGAVASADILIVEASAVGPEIFVAVAGSGPAAAVAARAETEVWLVAGEGRVLPDGLWQGLEARWRSSLGDEPWEADEELVPLDLVDHVVGPRGRGSIPSMLRRADVPVAAELLRELR